MTLPIWHLMYWQLLYLVVSNTSVNEKMKKWKNENDDILNNIME